MRTRTRGMGRTGREREGSAPFRVLSWDGGLLHAAALGQMGVELTEEQLSNRRSKRKLGKRCPVCLEEIGDLSTTCHGCVYEWQRILKSPRRLARWVADAAKEPSLRHTIVWSES